jgi:RHS repeat-associated protein
MKRLFLTHGRAVCVALLLWCGAHGTAAACDADPNGPPNCAAAGNPINVITGNKFQVETDLPALPGVLGLEIVRYYNSGLGGRHNTLGVLGRGWRLSYESELVAIGDTVQIRAADGTRYIFSRDVLRPSLCNSTNPSDGTVTTRRTAAGEEFVWRQNDGRRLTFNQRGRLVQIQAPTGEFVSLQHDARGLLVKVTDPQGRSLVLNYLPGKDAEAGDRFRGVQSIDSPVGRFGYGYGSPLPPGADASDPGARLANLVRVSLPGGQDQARLYHYEDARRPTFLTGVSVAGHDDKGKPVVERYSTFGYDIDGKAILSTHPGGADKVTLDTSVGGRTVLTNSLGQKTVYRYSMVAGAFRLLEVRGAGCALCGEMDVRYGYDSLGRMSEVTKLDRDGQPLHTTKTELDYYGRPRKVSKVVYHNGKAGAAQLVARYEYADGTALTPSRIVRPSVVPGQEAQIEIMYNNAGQPLTVTERGWSPVVQGTGAPVAIARTTRYDYRVINGRSVLAQIDGPLPNGKSSSPVDSDITQFEYDARGNFVRRMIAPGGIVTEVRERDAALRPVAVRRTDDHLQWTAYTRANWRGDTEVSSMDAALVNDGMGGKQTRTLRYRYDAFGNLAGMTQPDNLSTNFIYDGAGRLAQRVRPDGSRVAFQQDTEGHKRGEAGSEQARGIEYDAWGRPVVWRGAHGAQLLQADWGAIGTAAQASVLTLNSRNAQAQRLLDDEGRVVAIKNPGQGWQTARYDVAGRVEESIDPRGSRLLAKWDPAGRLLRLERFAPGGRTPEQVLSYSYLGAWPSAETITDADGTRSTLTERDARGRTLRETLRIVPAGPLLAALAQPIQFSQSYRYDAQGRLLARTLTDNAGRTLELAASLDDQGLPTRVAAVGMLPAWLGGGRALIDHIQWQRLDSGPYATEIAHSDGSVDRYERINEDRASAANGPAQAMVGGAAGAEGIAGVSRGDDTSTSSAGPGREHDVAGLPSAIMTGKGNLRLRWNAAGQLMETQRTQGSSRYVYDARGRRVVKLVTDAQGQTRASLSVYEERRLIAEADAEGRASFAYVYVGWRPVAQIDLRTEHWWETLQARLFGASPRHLHTSRAGKVLSVTEEGKVVWQDEADNRSFGVHQPLRYVGQYHDDDSGIDYHGARYFEPQSGRFISPDPRGVADAVNEIAGTLLLDLYAYAGGQPEDYFDPDGAARVRYFAITTNPSGQALGTNQGFTKARWAFIVDGIQGGGDSSALGQKRNEYAQNGTGLLVDASGDFLKSGQSATTWTGGNSGIPDLFAEHYGNNLISIPQFTIDNMSDDDATALIASYISADRQALFPNACPARSTLLPQIKFGTGDANINVMSATANGANKQRILACGAGSNADITLRRIAKYEAAAEVNETARINRDCSATGCPGIGYYCDATKCYARDQLAFGQPNTHEPVYTPSYGRSQFIASTLVSELLSGYNLFTADELAQLGLTQSMKSLLQSAKDRGENMLSWWKNAKKATDFAAANQAWANLSAADKAKFTAETGLGERAYVDMIRIKTQPPTNTKGDDLSADAKQALVTSAIMSDAGTKAFLMGIFQDFDKFSLMSHALMHKNLDAALQYQPNASEEYLAAMVARAHNGGSWKRTYQDLITVDEHKYVKNFVGTSGNTANGDWKSLRCTENLGTNTVKPGTQGKGIGGLEMTPLQLK